jgi:ectoine hydroxylase-related dioxygenase (phytanoyl-CoA dioxygenase family)
MQKYQSELLRNGFSIIPEVFSETEISKIVHCIESANSNSDVFLQTKDLFAIRQLLKHIPELQPLIFTANFKNILLGLNGEDCFLTKAIYFDKPEKSNWFVAYHQDLSISVSNKKETTGYQNWTKKRGQIGVQAPKEILESIFTIRIHLDDTNEQNGALKVIPKSHSNGILRLDSLNLESKQETFCSVEKGGIMLMKPLLFHASNRSTGNRQRRVIHLEFSNRELAEELDWAERLDIV